MPNTVKLGGVLFSRGDVIALPDRAADYCNAPHGAEVELYIITNEDIGLKSMVPISTWHDLDGRVQNRRGWWIPGSVLSKLMSDMKRYNPSVIYRVKQSVVHRGIDLKDKLCRIICPTDSELVFVEFEEYVLGCSADGRGKSGHCVALHPSILREEKNSKAAKKAIKSFAM